LDGLPEAGGDSRLTHPVHKMAGGSAVNSATHLVALERESTDDRSVTLHTAINPTDDFGKLMLNHTATHGIPFINCAHENEFSASTGHCIVIVANNERSFMTHQGVIAGLAANKVHFNVMAHEANIIHVHIAGFYNIQGFWDGQLQERIAWLRQTRKEQTTCISLVTQHDATGEWDGGLVDLLPCLDFVFLNDLEAKYVTRLAGEDVAMEHFVEYFARVAPNTCAIITRGEHGAIAIRNGIIIAKQAAVKVLPIDPTGAGDAFCAGFLKGIWDWRRSHPRTATGGEWPPQAIQSALALGCSVATCSVLTRGASIPSDPIQIQEFMRQTMELV